MSVVQRIDVEDWCPTANNLFRPEKISGGYEGGKDEKEPDICSLTSSTIRPYSYHRPERFFLFGFSEQFDELRADHGHRHVVHRHTS